MPDATDARSLADLARQLSMQTTQLARQEVELAKAELSLKAKTAGKGAGMFGGAGVFAVYALGALTAAAIAALALVFDTWLAALIVGGVYLLIAGILALRGKANLARATPPVPERAVESVKEDVRFTKKRVKEGRR